VNDGGEEREFALIGDLGSSRFPYQVREYIFEVDRIKSGKGKKADKKISPSGTGFFPEFSGQ
jgi:hypothetical protein